MNFKAPANKASNTQPLDNTPHNGNLEKIIALLDINMVEVFNEKDLLDTQDSYLLHSDTSTNMVAGLNLTNIDLAPIYQTLFAVDCFRVLKLKNVNLPHYDFLAGLQQLRFLDISDNGLTVLPEVLNSLSQLQHLNIGSNGLTIWPNELNALNQLQHLDISGNSLSIWPSELNELSQLRHLNISDNGLMILPDGLNALSQLLHLNISDNDLTRWPDELNALSQLEHLDISGNKLKTWPDELNALSQLQHLNISHNDLTTWPDNLDALSQLQHLNISRNRLTTWPDELNALSQLQHLDISSNKFKTWPDELNALSQLQHLNISGNKFKTWPGELTAYSQLQHLNISRNRLTTLPDTLNTLSQLQHLNISFNGLTTWPDALSTLNQLQHLDISFNGLTTWPDDFNALIKLQHLDISINRLTTWPDELNALIKLQHLDISHNRLTTWPEKLNALSQLQHLEIGSNDLTTWPEKLNTLSQLQHLGISDNRLTTWPDDLNALSQLQHLDISDNFLTAWPDELNDMSQLQYLDISDNGLTTLPEGIFVLKRLAVLKLKSWVSLLDDNPNKISTIPDAIVYAKLLRLLAIEEEHLDGFYATALEDGIKNLQNAIAQKIAQGIDHLYEAKLLFVGQPGAGKSSLMEKVLDKNYVLPTKKEEISTIGIDIKEHNFKSTIQNKAVNFRTNMWDFGGQEVQYMSHQFFLTPNSLYVLVGDDRKQDTEFDYWFHIIGLLSHNSPILVVLNEVNHISITNFDLQGYKNLFNDHDISKEDIDLSNMGDGRYEVLKNKMEHMLCNLPHVGEEIPARWVDIRQALNTIAQTEYYITFARFQTICEQYDLTLNDANTLSKHFHNLGIFLHYLSDTNGLADTIFLNPKWVMDGIYSVLANKDVNDNNGKFTKQWVFNFWNNHVNQYNDDIKNKLLTLMHKDKFEICYKLDAVGDIVEDTFISPQLLPSVLAYDYTWHNDNNLFYRFQYPFMPKGIVARLIVRLHHLVHIENNAELVWQKGVILFSKQTKARVVETVSKDGVSIIDIALDGDKLGQQELLHKIKHEIEYIHQKSFKNITYSEMVPCNCSGCSHSSSPHYYEFDILKRFLLKEKYTIDCYKTSESVSIAQLLGNVMNEQSSKQGELSQLLKKDGQFVIKNYINNSSNNEVEVTDSFTQDQGQKQQQDQKQKQRQKQSTTIDISIQLNGLVSSMNSLDRKLNDYPEEKAELGDLIEELNNVDENATPEEVKNSGILTDIEDYITDFDGKLGAGEKVLDKTSKVVKSVKSLAKKYNGLADLCGLPHVPSLLID